MIQLADLLKLPPSPERDALIDAERQAVHARYEEVRSTVAARLSVAEATRRRGAALLAQLPRDPELLIQMRRQVLLDAITDPWGKKAAA